MTSAKLRPVLPSMELAADERTTLSEMLEYYRAVLIRKASGLDAKQLAQPLSPSTLTLGGLLLHLAFVEEFWFRQILLDEPEAEPWASAPWAHDADWEMTVAPTWPVEKIWDQYHHSMGKARLAEATVASLDQLSARQKPEGTDVNVRWIYVHMIEEYSRHCGHADFLRQAIDGAIGD